MRGLHLFRFVLIISTLLSCLSAAARPAPDDDHANYYNVSESLEDVATPSLDPIHTIKMFSEELPEATYSLLRWTLNNTPLEKPPEKYNRQQQFGGWLVDKRVHGCFNTRALVLVRDSVTNTTTSPSGCTIATGEWHDKAVNQTFTESRDVEIDHFVPLKNIYISGAWKWTQEKRCMYTNFMGNKLHLTPFFKSENRKKADNTPEHYMPPERSYRCEYLYKWLTIKLIWQVAINPKEAAAILAYVKSEQCDVSKFIVDTNFVAEQRRYIEENKELCNRNNVSP